MCDESKISGDLQKYTARKMDKGPSVIVFVQLGRMDTFNTKRELLYRSGEK